MDGGLLSLKWNNHRSTLFYMLSTVRKKECYTDVTLACDGKFYSVHKLVLSMCSEYFEQMFEQTQCKHPVIVLKDIKSEELESLLSYMYVGEVNVVQEKLSGLIKAAECLKIKGLAVPDEEPCSKTNTSREKRSSDNNLSSEPKRRRQDDGGNTSSFRQALSNNRNDDRRKSLDHPSSSTSNKLRNTNNSSNVNSTRSSSGDRESGDRGSVSSRAERLSSQSSNNQQQSAVEVKTEEHVEALEAEATEEVMIEEPPQAVKEEPTDADAVYLSDSNSVPDHKEDVLLDSFSDVGQQQQHFMDELLGHASESNQGNMGVEDYGDGGEGSSGTGSQLQQPMVDDSFSADSQLTTNCLAIQMEEGSVDLFNSSLDSLVPLLEPLSSVEPQTWQSENPLPPNVVPVDQLDFNLLLTNRKNYRCPICSKETINRFTLKRHYMLHTGEKPFKCQFCDFRGSRREHIRLHIHRTHRH